jgi:hypothetical protein
MIRVEFLSVLCNVQAQMIEIGEGMREEGSCFAAHFFPGDLESYGVLLLVPVEKNKCRCASQNVLVSSMCAGKCCRWSRSAGGGGGAHQSVVVASFFLLL